MPNGSSGSVRVFYLKTSREQIIASLRERLPSLAEALPLRRVVLFGSWARGRATVASDIDLLVVYAGEVREDAYATVWRTLDIRGLEAHVYAEAEAAAVQATLDRMTVGGVTLL